VPPPQGGAEGPVPPPQGGAGGPVPPPHPFYATVQSSGSSHQCFHLQVSQEFVFRTHSAVQGFSHRANAGKGMLWNENCMKHLQIEKFRSFQ